MIKVEYHQFFELFGEANRAELLRVTEHRLYESGACIFDEGASPDALYLVLDGQVELRKRTEKGAVEVLARLCGDECFGEMGVLDGGGRSAAAYTVTDARLASIPREALLEALRNEPSMTVINMFRRISDRLRRTDADYVSEAFRHNRVQQVGEVSGSLLRFLDNPITAIHRLTSASGGDEKVSALIGEQADRIKHAVELLAHMDADPTPVARQNQSTETLLSTFALQNQYFLESKNIKLQVQSGAEAINVDPVGFLDVLQALLNNAVEAGARTVTLDTYWQPSTLELSFRDDGDGVPERIRDTLFSPFVTEGKSRALGLGLAVATSIVKAHGGYITYQPEERKGSIFIVSIPIGSQ